MRCANAHPILIQDVEGMLTFRGVCQMLREIHSQIQPVIRGGHGQQQLVAISFSLTRSVVPGLQQPRLSDIMAIARSCNWKYSRWGRVRKAFYAKDEESKGNLLQIAAIFDFTLMYQQIWITSL